MMDAQHIKNIIEACLLVAGKAMSLRQLDELFEGDEDRPDRDTIKTCIEQLQADYEGRGIELVQVASGYRLQSRTEVSQWVARLFPEKPPRYSRALLETLVLVAYRQPITRGEIEEIRGVAVSSNIVKTLQERQWVKEVGFKDVPGKPALLGTTKHFLDYFNLKRLDDLPPLSEIKNLEEMDAALMEAAGIAPAQDAEAANDGEMSEGDLPDSAEVIGIDTDDAPVTFAGLVSDLPPLEPDVSDDGETGSDDPTRVVSSEPAVAVSDAELDVELSESEEQSVDATETSSNDPDTEQQKLYSKISEFAAEHQEEVDARDQLESQLVTRNTEPEEQDTGTSPAPSNDEGVNAEAELVTADVDVKEKEMSSTAESLADAIDASSASLDALSETFTGDSLGAGETLH